MVLRFFEFSRKLIMFLRFFKFNEIWKYGFEISFFSRLRRANWCIFKENRWFAPKIPQNFRLRRENLRSGFEIFRKFQNFDQCFEIFQKLPNLECGFEIFRLRRNLARGVLTGRGGFRSVLHLPSGIHWNHWNGSSGFLAKIKVPVEFGSSGF